MARISSKMVDCWGQNSGLVTWMSDTFTARQREILEYFRGCSGAEQTYEKIIQLGRNQQPLPEEQRCEENRVAGCQSQLYLWSQLRDGRLYFQAESDALISAGLAQLLIWAYNGEKAETILTAPPAFLSELAIPASLSPSRANGLASLHLRMRQEALKALSRPAY
jgi:sulfur transfer protein SufE